MKVYVSVDMEGVATVSAREEVTRGTDEYAAAQAQMTDETAAALDGAYSVGANEIYVKDSHWTGRNLDARKLAQPEGKTLRLVRGWSGHPFSMVQELDDSFGSLVFVGYHAAASRDGNPLSHTLSSRLIASLKLNDEPVPEFLIFSYAASLVGVPARFISGDKAICDYARAKNETIVAVPTFEGHGASVVSLPPAEASRRIREGVAEALRSERGRVLALPKEFHARITFRDHAEAYRRSFYPGARLENGFDVVLETREYFDVLRLLKFMTM